MTKKVTSINAMAKKFAKESIESTKAGVAEMVLDDKTTKAFCLVEQEGVLHFIHSEEVSTLEIMGSCMAQAMIAWLDVAYDENGEEVEDDD